VKNLLPADQGYYTFVAPLTARRAQVVTWYLTKELIQIPANILPDDWLTIVLGDATRKTAALCVFRIVQEGLRNAKKYSGVKQAMVELRSAGENLQISRRTCS
jgi:hypothetical protein